MGFGTEYAGAFAGSLSSQTDSGRFKPTTIPSPPIVITAVKPSVEDFGTGVGDPATIVTSNFEYSARDRRTFDGFCGKTISEQWFDKVYVLPLSIDAGIILSEQTADITLYSSYKTEDRTWTTYSDASLGAGVSLDTSPPPSVVFPPHSGATRTLTISLNGPPTINGTADFTFDGGIGVISVTVTGTRSVLFPFEPETPIEETLEFLTDVLRSRNGKEQRRALRKNPRQILEFDILTDGQDRRLLENLIFDGQDRAFGVPLWYEPTALTVAAIATDLTITVEETTSRDFRVGGLAVLWNSPFDYEALEVSAVTSTTITFASALQGNFSVGTRVMPVVSAHMVGTPGQTRWVRNLQKNRVKFRVIDNDVDIASTTGFSTYSSRVLLDDANVVDGNTVSESWSRTIHVLDNGTGTPYQATDQAVSRKGSSKGFVTSNLADLLNVRELLHHLKGRAISFYLPTFFPDFVPDAAIGSADASIDVEAVNYVDSVQSRQPRNIIRVVKTDGTASDPKLVTSATAPSAGVERLSISPDTVGITAAVADVERIEYIEKVRIDTDQIKITHYDGKGGASCLFPVITVLEEDD